MVSRGGFSLVEAEIALVVFAAGLLAIAASAARSAESLRAAEARSGAVTAALSIADSLAQLEQPTNGTSSRSRYTARWVTSVAGGVTHIRVRIQYADGIRIMTDSVDVIAASWPRRLNRVP